MTYSQVPGCSVLPQGSLVVVDTWDAVGKVRTKPGSKQSVQSPAPEAGRSPLPGHGISASTYLGKTAGATWACCRRVHTAGFHASRFALASLIRKIVDFTRL